MIGGKLLEKTMKLLLLLVLMSCVVAAMAGQDFNEETMMNTGGRRLLLMKNIGREDSGDVTARSIDSNVDQTDGYGTNTGTHHSQDMIMWKDDRLPKNRD